MPIEIAWRFAKAFFGDYLDPRFRGRSHREDVEICKSVGLTSDFWVS